MSQLTQPNVRAKEIAKAGLRCLTHTLWRDLSSRISDFLNNITLGELMTDNEVLEISDRQDIDLAVTHGLSNKNTTAAPIGVNVRS